MVLSIAGDIRRPSSSTGRVGGIFIQENFEL